MSSRFSPGSVKKTLIYGLVLFSPLFFLSFSPGLYAVNPLYFPAFLILTILLIEAFNIGLKKELVFFRHPLNLNVLFLVLACSLSVIVASPNKVQAVVSKPLGLGVILFLALFWFIAIQIDADKLWSLAKISALVVSLLFLFFRDQLEAGLFLGFFVIMGLFEFATSSSKSVKQALVAGGFLLIVLVSFCINLYYLLTHETLTRLPPYSLSLRAAYEVLKKPTTGLVGGGIDNLVVFFARTKTPAFNQTEFWTVNLTQARSFFLQLLAETGFLGLLAFGLFLGLLFVSVKNNHKRSSLIYLGGLVYLTVAFLVFPPSLAMLFLLFLLAAVIVLEKRAESSQVIKLSPPVFLRITLAVVIFLLSTVGFYFVGRFYLSEYFFQKAIGGLRRNQGNEGYQDMKKAVILNPYDEGLRLEFSRLNLLIANAIASKSAKDRRPQDKKLITASIETAISEAKAGVALNPNKPSHWANLAYVYKNLVRTINGADIWAVAAYERAIVADPVNPSLRLDLGGVYYATGRFDEADKIFRQAIALKPDWPNAYYNRAWALFAKKDYRQAVAELEKALSLTPRESQAFQKIKRDLAEFKKQLQDRP